MRKPILCWCHGLRLPAPMVPCCNLLHRHLLLAQAARKHTRWNWGPGNFLNTLKITNLYPRKMYHNIIILLLKVWLLVQQGTAEDSTASKLQFCPASGNVDSFMRAGTPGSSYVCRNGGQFVHGRTFQSTKARFVF